MWQASHLRGVYWDTDEGLNLIKARLLQLGDPLYMAVWSDQPPGLTVLLAGAFELFGASVPVGRAVVLAHAVIALLATAWLVREAGGGRLAAFGAVLALALAPNVFWASRAVMIGLPALALLLLSLALLLAGLRTRRRGLLLLAGLVLGCSLLEKLLGLAALPAIVVAVGLAAWPRRGEGRASDAALWGGGLRDGFALLLGLSIPLAAALLAFAPEPMLAQVLGGLLGAPGSYALDRGENLADLWAWLWGTHRYLVGFAALGLAATVASIAGQRSGTGDGGLPDDRRGAGVAPALLLVWLFATLWGTIDRAPLWPKHHFLSLLVILAPLAGIGLERAWQIGWAWPSGRGTGVRRVGESLAASQGAAGRASGGLSSVAAVGAVERAWGGAGLLALLVAFGGASLTADALAKRVDPLPYKANGELPSHSQAWRRLDEAVAMLRRHTAPGDVIVTDHVFAAFVAQRRVPPDLAVISGKRIATGDLSAERVVAGIEAARPAAILLWDNDRLRRIESVASWIEANYVLVESLDGEWELWGPAP